MGQFAPLGGEQTAAQLALPWDWVSIGRSSQWLWYSIYARYFHAAKLNLSRIRVCFQSWVITTFALIIDSFIMNCKLYSKQVSWRTRTLVVSDWGRRFIFGRDSSRIWFFWEASKYGWFNHQNEDFWKYQDNFAEGSFSLQIRDKVEMCYLNITWFFRIIFMVSVTRE